MAKDMQIKLTKEQKRVCKIDEFLEEVKSSLQKKDVLLWRYFSLKSIQNS